MLLLSGLVTSLVALSPALAHSIHAAREAESHTEHTSLPGTWYHEDDHPIHELFKRDGATTDGVTYATVGSDAWSNAWSENRPTKDKLPSAWFDALDAAVQAGTIPNLNPSTQSAPGTNPTYGGKDPNSPEVCSQTYQCLGEGVIRDAPAGYFASGFDDGPLPPSNRLIDFLQTNNVKTTHFMIGQNILWNPQVFLKAFNAGHDIAVHTWTHPYMTTLTNEEVVAELGYTMEIIRNSTGGRIPKYWRAPYGDSDNRVNAIAKQVFNLTMVWWNQDTEDWSIGSAGGTTEAKVLSQLQGWLAGNKTTGLIILEHELMNVTVDAFITTYPSIAKAGWKFASITSLFDNASPYKNTDDSGTAPVVSEDLLGPDDDFQASPSGSAGASGSGASGSGSPSGTSTSASQSASNTHSGAAASWTRSGLLSTSILSSVLLYLLFF